MNRRALVAGVMVAALALVPNQVAAVPGDLDPSFGAGGQVTLATGSGAGALDVAIAPDGKIVAAGGDRLLICTECSYDLAYRRPAVARFNSDGTPDTTFGSDGLVTLERAAGTRWHADGIVVQPDGKPVVAGWMQRKVSDDDFVLARFRASGKLDKTFGGDGIVTTDFKGNDDGAAALALQADGKLVAAGYTYPQKANNGDVALARYNTNGTLDATFGVNGRAVGHLKGDQGAMGVQVLADGRIYVGSRVTFNVGLFVQRYLADGTLDTSFGGDGMASVPLDLGESYYVGFAVQPDGKPIVANGHGAITGTSTFTLVRFNTDGTPDAGFGTGGVEDVPVPSKAVVHALAVQSDGKILAAGGPGYGQLRGTQGAFVVARFLTNGSLDTSFSGDGIASTDFDDGAAAYGIALQPDGKAVVAGNSGDDQETSIALARYETG